MLSFLSYKQLHPFMHFPSSRPVGIQFVSSQHREILLVKTQPGGRKQIASASDLCSANANRYGHIFYFSVVRTFCFSNRFFILDMQNCRHETQGNICARLISNQVACKFFVILSASLLYCHSTFLPFFQSTST